jgi:hypothetical protein
MQPILKPMVSSRIPAAISEILEMVHTDARVLPATALYNESWVLRLVLHAASRGIDCLPFSFAKNARWFSEPSLYTAFAPNAHKDSRGESRTRADGVVGHFDIKPGTRTGLILRRDATQLIVLEAKIGSKLASGVTHDASFDQAARSVACIAQTLSMAKRSPQAVQCGFFVIAPQLAIDNPTFGTLLVPDGIRQRINDRIEKYEDPRVLAHRIWHTEWVEPLLKTITIAAWSWEASIERIRVHSPVLGSEIDAFYHKTLEFNERPARLANAQS